MKSFANHCNGHKFLPSLQNTSFESPSLTTNSFIYHNNLNQNQNQNQNQKNSIIWVGGVNAINEEDCKAMHRYPFGNGS